VWAGIQYTLSEAAEDGHCYLPEPNLIADAARLVMAPVALPADIMRDRRTSGGAPTVRQQAR
jgi:exodeoxyribonuclease V alpha subunit